MRRALAIMPLIVLSFVAVPSAGRGEEGPAVPPTATEPQKGKLANLLAAAHDLGTNALARVKYLSENSSTNEKSRVLDLKRRGLDDYLGKALEAVEAALQEAEKPEDKTVRGLLGQLKDEFLQIRRLAAEGQLGADTPQLLAKGLATLREMDVFLPKRAEVSTAAEPPVPATGASAARTNAVVLGPDVSRAVTNALEYMKKIQDEDGGWSDKQYPGNTGVAGLACLAFLAQGSQPGKGDYGEVLGRGREFLMANAQRTGVLVGMNANKFGPMYEHLLSMLALLSMLELNPEDFEVRRLVSLGRAALEKAQKLDGGWRYSFSSEGQSDLRVTALALWVLRYAGELGFKTAPERLEKGAAFAAQCGVPDGGFRYRYWGLHPMPALGSAGIIALTAPDGAGEHPLLPRARLLLWEVEARMTAEDFNAREYTMFGCLHVGIAMLVSGPHYWEPWSGKMAPGLVGLQEKDGAIAPDHRGNRVYPTAVAAVLLQLPLGHLKTAKGTLMGIPISADNPRAQQQFYIVADRLTIGPAAGELDASGNVMVKSATEAVRAGRIQLTLAGVGATATSAYTIVRADGASRDAGTGMIVACTNAVFTVSTADVHRVISSGDVRVNVIKPFNSVYMGEKPTVVWGQGPAP